MSPPEPSTTSQCCNICGGTEFLPGPGGRKAPSGLPPLCAGCHSLERHRSIRSALDKIRTSHWKEGRAIQLSEDKSIDPAWFRQCEISNYPGPDAIDICRIDRPDNHFDFVFVNHVLEHVRDDAVALRELLRVTSDRGLLLVTVPAPLKLRFTNDWGFPDLAQHGHYRMYGRDAIPFFAGIDGRVSLLFMVEEDAVTGDREPIFVYTRNSEIERHVLAQNWAERRKYPPPERRLVVDDDIRDGLKASLPRRDTASFPDGDIRVTSKVLNYINSIVPHRDSMLAPGGSEAFRDLVSQYCGVSDFHDGWPDETRKFGQVLLVNDLGQSSELSSLFHQCNRCLEPGGYLLVLARNMASHLSIGALIEGDDKEKTNQSGPLERQEPVPALLPPREGLEYAPKDLARRVAAQGFSVLLGTVDTELHSPEQEAIMRWVHEHATSDFTLHRDSIVIFARKTAESAAPVSVSPAYNFRVLDKPGEEAQATDEPAIRIVRTEHELREALTGAAMSEPCRNSRP